MDATREHVPLSQLTASEVVDIDFIDAAQAGRDAVVSATDTPATSPLSPSDDSTRHIDDAARHIAVVLGTVASGMLASDKRLMADATSYEDISEDELELFDEARSFSRKKSPPTNPSCPNGAPIPSSPATLSRPWHRIVSGWGIARSWPCWTRCPSPNC